MAFLIFAFSLLLNLLTLLIPLKRKQLLNNPAFIVGDFILIPLFFTYALTNIPFSLQPILIFISSAVVITWGYLFKLVKSIWIPHGIIAVVIVYYYLLAIPQKNSEAIIVLTLLLLTHQFLGFVFPKKAV